MFTTNTTTRSIALAVFLSAMQDYDMIEYDIQPGDDEDEPIVAVVSFAGERTQITYKPTVWRLGGTAMMSATAHQFAAEVALRKPAYINSELKNSTLTDDVTEAMNEVLKDYGLKSRIVVEKGPNSITYMIEDESGLHRKAVSIMRTTGPDALRHPFQNDKLAMLTDAHRIAGLEISMTIRRERAAAGLPFAELYPEAHGEPFQDTGSHYALGVILPEEAVLVVEEERKNYAIPVEFETVFNPETGEVTMRAMVKGSPYSLTMTPLMLQRQGECGVRARAASFCGAIAIANGYIEAPLDPSIQRVTPGEFAQIVTDEANRFIPGGPTFHVIASHPDHFTMIKNASDGSLSGDPTDVNLKGDHPIGVDPNIARMTGVMGVINVFDRDAQQQELRQNGGLPPHLARMLKAMGAEIHVIPVSESAFNALMNESDPGSGIPTAKKDEPSV